MSKRFYRVESQQDLMAYMDRGEMAQQENRWTLEIAWECANKGTGKLCECKCGYHCTCLFYQFIILLFSWWNLYCDPFQGLCIY